MTRAATAVATVLSLSLILGASFLPTDAAAGLPQSQEYQRVLRGYMATLKQQDFEHGVTNHLAVPAESQDLETQYRTHIMAMLQQPHVGGKRGIGALNSPARNFLLSTIEATNAIIVPPVWEEAMATFIRWDSPGNVYRDNRALKMRAFVTAAVKLMMVDEYMATNAASGTLRADWSGYHLITAASAYPVFKAELPAEVRKAYEEGLLRFGRRIVALGPKGEECDYELSAAVGLWYAAQATADAGFAREAEDYARRLCTDPKFFSPAGCWVEAGGLDVGFGGMANFWAVWLALASDWPFAREAVDKAYRLRTHLILPEPSGALTGPSAFNNRLGSPASEDQWHWDGARDHGAAMLTDEALCLIKPPTEAELADALARRTAIFAATLYGNLRNAPYKHPTGERYLGGDPKTGRYLENDEIRGYRWGWRIFPNGFNYPIEVNPSYEFYRPGSYARLAALQKEDSPLLRSPYLRPDEFVRTFGDAFVAARKGGFGAILHVGPVGNPAPEAGMAQYKGPMGFGGGQLSAFWTPKAGAVILGRRGGLAMRGTETLSFDSNQVWRLWPVHAVSGCTKDGKVFSSARIVAPLADGALAGDGTTARVGGAIPVISTNTDDRLAGRLDYARTFAIDAKGVRIETTVSGDGKDEVDQLVETIPLYLGDGKALTNGPVAVEVLSADGWTAAEPGTPVETKAIRVSRLQGAIAITFDTPHRITLSADVWKDTFLTRAQCRNILIDLAGSRSPVRVTEPIRVSYVVSPADP